MAPTRFDLDQRQDARYCPSCGGAFRPEVERCRHCDEPLLSRAEAERLDPAGSDDAEVAIASLGNAAEVELIRGTLAQAGIPHRIDHHLIPQFGVADSAFGAELWVMQSDAPEARKILDDLESDLAPDPAPEEIAEEPTGQPESGDHPLSRRSLRFRLLRGGLLASGVWFLFLAAAYGSAGETAAAAIGLVPGVTFVALWRLAHRAPRRAFAMAAVMTTILLAWVVLAGWSDPALRASPATILALVMAVLAYYWGWQSAPD